MAGIGPGAVVFVPVPDGGDEVAAAPGAVPMLDMGLCM